MPRWMCRPPALPALISATFDSLANLGAPAATTLAPPPVGAVSLRRRLASPEHIISMLDGKPYRTLKRHLATHGMTPADYRARYQLPASYPMVAPAYAAMRSTMAHGMSLGHKRRKAD